MKSKQGESKINVILIIMLVLGLIMGVLLIILSKSKTEVKTIGKNADKVKKSYTSTEESTNTWDISENGDGTVIATLSEDGTLTISGTGNMKGNITEWEGVLESIKYVIIENGVTNIGNWAFFECNNLINIKIPNSVIEIGIGVFIQCNKLKNIEVDDNNPQFIDEDGVLYTKDKTEIMRYPPGKNESEYSVFDSVTTIGYGAFENCDNLRKIDIPNVVTNIKVYAFTNSSNFDKIKIPDNLEEIGYQAFAGCNSLADIEVSENNTKYMDENGVLYTKDKTAIIKYPEAKDDKQFEIPNGVVTISNSAFLGCYNLVNIKIPNSVEVIENYAFSDCYRLSKILIPNSVTKIGYGVFFYSDNVTIFGQKSTAIETYAKSNNINYLIIMDEIQPKTIANQIDLQNEYEIFNGNGEIVVETEFVGTGFIIKMADGENYITIVKGDSTGDGQADFKDILAINKCRLSGSSLDLEYQLAGDVNEDGQLDVKDIFDINKYRLGTMEQL